MRAVRFKESEHYTVDAATGCWLWSGYIGFGGFAYFAGRRVHRLVYEEMVRSIPEGWVVDHTCDNGVCINPGHLEAIDYQTVRRRRSRKVLSDFEVEDVLEVRSRAEEGEPLGDIAADYGVHPNTIGDIALGKRWAEVGGYIGRPERHCPECGDRLPDDKRRDARFCSPPCRTKNGLRRRRAEKRGRRR